MADSKLRELDARLVALPGPAKVIALMSACGVRRKDVAKIAGTYAMDVTRELRGEGSENEDVRNALGELLAIPRGEVDDALAVGG